jgi:hypothetical protein
MPWLRHNADTLAPGSFAASTNISFEPIVCCAFQGTAAEDTCQRCPGTNLSAMSWYSTGVDDVQTIFESIATALSST